MLNYELKLDIYILIYFDIPTASKLECISRLILLQGKVCRYV